MLRTLTGDELEDEGARAAAVVYAAELLAATACQLDGDLPIQGLVAQFERAGLGGPTLAREVLRAPPTLALPPSRALEVQLRLLSLFAPLRGVSLWSADAAGRVSCVKHVGAGATSGVARELARGLIADGPPDGESAGELFGSPIDEPQRVSAALVARARPEQRGRCRPLLAAALPTLAAILERDALMTRNAAGERALVEGGERRLVRLGFDLHDGPLQELLLLVEDLRLFREQLGDVLGGEDEGKLLRGRVDDLEARLLALEGGLRRISTSLHAGVLINRPLSAALGDVIDAFGSRTGIEPQLTLEGEATSISASQRIALLSVIGEALNNVREHSEASEVQIDVSLDAAGVQAQVRDDGRGFDVETALVDAARRGRIGLAGIHERVRMLGGRCTVDSRPGGPTVISLTLAPWEPLAAADPPAGQSSVDATGARGA